VHCRPAWLASFLALGALATGCASSYTSLGYEVARTSRGTSSTAVTGGGQPSGSVAVGFGSASASMEIVLHGQDVEMTADPWMAATAGLELKLRPIRVGPVAAFVHGGPMRAALFNRESLELAWGAGLAYGGGLMIGRHGIHLVVDARAEELFYAGAEGSPMGGTCALRSIAVGVQLGR